MVSFYELRKFSREFDAPEALGFTAQTVRGRPDTDIVKQFNKIAVSCHPDKWKLYSGDKLKEIQKQWRYAERAKRVLSTVGDRLDWAEFVIAERKEDERVRGRQLKESQREVGRPEKSPERESDVASSPTEQTEVDKKTPIVMTTEPENILGDAVGADGHVDPRKSRNRNPPAFDPAFASVDVDFSKLSINRRQDSFEEKTEQPEPNSKAEKSAPPPKEYSKVESWLRDVEAPPKPYSLPRPIIVNKSGEFLRPMTDADIRAEGLVAEDYKPMKKWPSIMRNGRFHRPLTTREALDQGMDLSVLQPLKPWPAFLDKGKFVRPLSRRELADNGLDVADFTPLRSRPFYERPDGRFFRNLTNSEMRREGYDVRLYEPDLD